MIETYTNDSQPSSKPKEKESHTQFSRRRGRGGGGGDKLFLLDPDPRPLHLQRFKTFGPHKPRSPSPYELIVLRDVKSEFTHSLTAQPNRIALSAARANMPYDVKYRSPRLLYR